MTPAETDRDRRLALDTARLVLANAREATTPEQREWWVRHACRLLNRGSWPCVTKAGP